MNAASRGGVERRPGAVPTVEAGVLRDLLGRLEQRLALASRATVTSSTRSSRCTTSRSYAAPSSRLRSWRRAARAGPGSSSASKLTRPRATGRPSGPHQVDRVAGDEAAGDAGDAGGQQRGAALGDRADGAGVEPSRPLGSVACASHSSRVGRRLPVASEQGADRLAGQRVAPPASAEVSTTGMPAPVAIRAASTLVCMPPVPTPGGAGLADPDAAPRSASARDLGDQARAGAGRVGRRRGRRRRRAAPAGRRAPGGRPARRAGRCHRTGSRWWRPCRSR